MLVEIINFINFFKRNLEQLLETLLLLLQISVLDTSLLFYLKKIQDHCLTNVEIEVPSPELFVFGFVHIHCCNIRMKY